MSPTLKETKETLSDRLQLALKQSGKKKVELAKEIGQSPQLIHKLLTTNVQRTQFIVPLAKALNVNVVWLASGEGAMRCQGVDNPNNLLAQYSAVPIIPFEDLHSYTDNPKNYCNKIDEFIYIQNSTPGLFATKVADASMDPTLRKSSVAVFDPSQTKLQDKDIALIYIDKRQDYFIRLYSSENTELFIPTDNELYKTIEVKQATVIGKLVAYQWEINK